MALIKVTSEELEGLSQNIQGGSTQIQGELQRMHNAVQPLVDGGWEGAASQQFHQLWEEWHTSAGQLQQALDGIAQLLHGASTTYAETESKIASSMGN